MMTTCSLTFPPQISLARVPTPVQPLRRLSERYGVQLFVKRDDLTGMALSGNKIRKLEFVLAGKAFFGMIQELKRDPGCFGDRIIFLHTGGIFGLFPKAGEIGPLL
ncbi:MAG: hypothetical protein P8X90_06605 [Desulfobacterales bacterium]|jgi:1-aminocyclopropane-1-carboxylate deaminase/D-cysteine desulfhydrase-like pyridoxal-dependent ACC family enzyme